MRDVLLLVAVAALTGCGRGDTAIDRTFDACEPLVLDLDGATADQRAGVADALALWRERGIGNLSIEPIDGAPVLPIVFESAAPAFHGFYDDEAGIVYVNVDLDDNPQGRAITIAHEIGHAFGLYHVPEDERVSLMNPHNLTVPPTAEDQQELVSLWGACTP